MPASSKEFLDIQATIECGFNLKCICDMIRTYSHVCRLKLWNLFKNRVWHKSYLKTLQNLWGCVLCRRHLAHGEYIKTYKRLSPLVADKTYFAVLRVGGYRTQSQRILCPGLNGTATFWWLVLAKTIILKNMFPKIQKYTCLKYLFLWSHWLNFCHFLHLNMIEKYKNTHSL